MANEPKSRADAQAALVAFQTARAARDELGGDDRENIADLIADLLHLVDSDSERFDGYDGGMVADTATTNYYEEREDERVIDTEGEYIPTGLDNLKD